MGAPELEAINCSALAVLAPGSPATAYGCSPTIPRSWYEFQACRLVFSTHRLGGEGGLLEALAEAVGEVPPRSCVLQSNDEAPMYVTVHSPSDRVAFRPSFGSARLKICRSCSLS